MVVNNNPIQQDMVSIDKFDELKTTNDSLHKKLNKFNKKLKKLKESSS
jgi:ribonuclease HIII